MIAPYFDGHGVAIYHGKCEDVLPRLAGTVVDLLLTDPPYGIDYQGNKRTVPLDRIAGDDGTLDVLGHLGLALRLLRRGRHVYVFGDFDLSSLPLSSQVDLIWDKGIVGIEVDEGHCVTAVERVTALAGEGVPLALFGVDA